MIFSLVVYASPSQQASHHALSFAQSLLEQKHTLYRVFFYGDGIHNTSDLLCPAGDERNTAKEWQAMKQSHDIDLVTCIAAGLKRGVVNEMEAKRNKLSNFNLISESELSGLGQLLDAALQSDRVITFA